MLNIKPSVQGWTAPPAPERIIRSGVGWGLPTRSSITEEESKSAVWTARVPINIPPRTHTVNMQFTLHLRLTLHLRPRTLNVNMSTIVNSAARAICSSAVEDRTRPGLASGTVRAVRGHLTKTTELLGGCWCGLHTTQLLGIVGFDLRDQSAQSVIDALIGTPDRHRPGRTGRHMLTVDRNIICLKAHFSPRTHSVAHSHLHPVPHEQRGHPW